MRNNNLDPMMGLSQMYDGAGNLLVKLKGAAAIFRWKTGNDKVKYFHSMCVYLKLLKYHKFAI